MIELILQISIQNSKQDLIEIICKHKQIFIKEFGVESNAISIILDRNVSKDLMLTINEDDISLERYHSMNDRAVDDDLSFISLNKEPKS